MVDQAAITMVKDIVTILGVIGGFTYYVMNVRATQRTQQLALKAQENSLETRQLELLLNHNQDLVENGISDYYLIMNAEWDDFEDYDRKYGLMNNQEFVHRIRRLWSRYNVTGLMIRDGVIDVETFVEYIGDAPVTVWDKYGEIIQELRKRYQLPTFMYGIEFLHGEINKYRIEKGWGRKVLDEMPDNEIRT